MATTNVYNVSMNLEVPTSNGAHTTIQQAITQQVPSCEFTKCTEQSKFT